MSGKPLRLLGIEIDLSSKKAKDDLADWNREVRESLGLSEDNADSVNEMAKEMREYAKNIGLSKEQLKELRETAKKNREIDDFAKKYGLQANEIKRMGAEARESEKRMSSLKGVMGGLAAVGIGAAVKSIGGEMLDLAKKAESSKIQFEVMLKSPQKAKETLNMLKEFSDVTPFSDTEAIAAGKQLINAKVPLDQLKQTLLEVGDVAAGSGVSFGELSEIYSKNKMSGLIQMEDVNQLAGRGIPIMDELARVMGVGSDQIRGLTSSGAIKFEHLRQAFANMSKEGGVYAGMMDRLSMSGEGLSSTFDSKLSSIKKTLGEVLWLGLKPLLSVGIEFLDWLQKSPVAMNILKAAFLIIIPVIGVLLVAALWAAATAAWALIAPLLPIIAIVALVGAAILGLILIIQDLYTFFTGGESVFGEWVESIKKKFTGALNIVKGWFNSAIEFFKQKGKYLIMAIFPISMLYFYWDQISAFLRSIPDKIIEFFKSIPSRIMSLLSGLKEKLKDLLPAPVMRIIAKISGNAEAIEARAGGGPVETGRPYLVGENEPEIFTPSSSGRITPVSSLRGGRGNVSISISPVIHINGAGDPETIASLVLRKIEELIPGIEAELGLEVG